MKKILPLAALLAVFLCFCKKEKSDPEPEETPAPASVDNYGSLADFYEKNGVIKETFTIDASTGGSFVSKKGSIVNVPKGAFPLNAGIVSLEFRDIFKKSDMLFSNMTTAQNTGNILVSSGEFFIKASINNAPAMLTGTTPIRVLLPNPLPKDTGMKAFVMGADTVKNFAWKWTAQDSLVANVGNYMYSLYQFAIPAGSGTWCNSDNPYYFGSVPKTMIMIHSNQTGGQIDVYLVFKNKNSMVHVYPTQWQSSNFAYSYAPLGYECTVVVIQVNDTKLASSFTPITIASNQTITVDLKATTTEEFKAAVKALD